MVAPLHRVGEQSATHFAGENGGNRNFEKDPDMAAISRS
jgi:hypothetical protein